MCLNVWGSIPGRDKRFFSSQKSLHQLWDPPRLLSVGIRDYFQEGKVIVVQGWCSEFMEQCQYSSCMPSHHGQEQPDFHNFYLFTTSVMWLYGCETFTVQKSNANAFWLGGFLKRGVVEDLSAINCEDGMWMKLAQNSSLKRRNYSHCIMLVFTVSIVWHCRMLGSKLHVACCVEVVPVIWSFAGYANCSHYRFVQIE